VSEANGTRPARKSDVIIGVSPWIKELHERINMVAATEVTVVISGESGTGKELVARTLHNFSPRQRKPFVVVNCAAIPESLLEDELFGHIRGAFTDANRDREGLFAAADGGTLFLDEIGEMSLGLQAKLLRVLQTHEFRRIGEDTDTRVDIRLVTATNIDLETAIAAGRFREDLFYRINVFPIHMQPLRERLEDVPLLAQHFLILHRAKVSKKVQGFSAEALQKLQSYDYPGNIRELENKIHHALVLVNGDVIEPEHIPMPDEMSRKAVDLDLDTSFRDLKREVVESFERAYTIKLLELHKGNLAAASRQAGIDRKNLWAMARRYGIEVKNIRARTRGGSEGD
jgi:transcriptional regulator with GAF, ATPase, and Fis domain